MNRPEWNALRVGQHVLVHDESDPASPLMPGRVTEVEPARGFNAVTIRVSPLGERTRIVQPSRLAVHLDSSDPIESCRRCESRFSSMRPSRPASPPR
jgi:hypothetical protein